MRQAKLTLDVKECLIFDRIFPPGHTFLECSMAIDMHKEVQLTKEDKELVSLTVSNGLFNWDEDIQFSKELIVSNSELEFLKECVEKLSKDKKITVENFSLCKKIRDAIIEPGAGE